MADYLNDRENYMAIHQSTSSSQKVKLGVREGSALDPTLFMIFINNLPAAVTFTNFVSLADDTTSYHPEYSLDVLDDQMRGDQIIITYWFTKNRMGVNHTQTQNIILSTRKGVPNNEPMKLLGVFLDPTMICDPNKPLISAYHALTRMRSLHGVTLLIKKYLKFKGNASELMVELHLEANFVNF